MAGKRKAALCGGEGGRETGSREGAGRGMCRCLGRKVLLVGCHGYVLRG